MLHANTSLKPHNTFGVDVSAAYYAEFDSIKRLAELLDQRKDLPLFILGGGSNILFTQDYKGLVLKNEILGFKTVEESNNSVVVEAGAGMNWHAFVLKCIDLNYGGVENLSLIPGNIGASPMQNIGAYGVEIKDVFEYLDAVDIETREVKRFYKTDCAFGYRESVFKRKLKGKYIICHVAYRLNKNNHTLNTSYGAIETELKNHNIENSVSLFLKASCNLYKITWVHAKLLSEIVCLDSRRIGLSVIYCPCCLHIALLLIVLVL